MTQLLPLGLLGIGPSELIIILIILGIPVSIILLVIWLVKRGKKKQ